MAQTEPVIKQWPLGGKHMEKANQIGPTSYIITISWYAHDVAKGFVEMFWIDVWRWKTQCWLSKRALMVPRKLLRPRPSTNKPANKLLRSSEMSPQAYLGWNSPPLGTMNCLAATMAIPIGLISLSLFLTIQARRTSVLSFIADTSLLKRWSLAYTMSGEHIMIKNYRISEIRRNTQRKNER